MDSKIRTCKNCGKRYVLLVEKYVPKKEREFCGRCLIQMKMNGIKNDKTKKR